MHLRPWVRFDTIQIMLKIRLAQTGKTNRKLYRIVAIEEGKKRNGKVKEILGSVDPLVHPARIMVKTDRIEYWLSKGAQMSDAVNVWLAKKG